MERTSPSAIPSSANVLSRLGRVDFSRAGGRCMYKTLVPKEREGAWSCSCCVWLVGMRDCA